MDRAGHGLGRPHALRALRAAASIPTFHYAAFRPRGLDASACTDRSGRVAARPRFPRSGRAAPMPYTFASRPGHGPQTGPMSSRAPNSETSKRQRRSQIRNLHKIVKVQGVETSTPQAQHQRHNLQARSDDRNQKSNMLQEFYHSLPVHRILHKRLIQVSFQLSTRISS